MQPDRPLPKTFVITVGVVLAATALISAVVAGPLALIFLAPVGCVCTSWAMSLAARRFSGAHLLISLVDTAIVAQWLLRRLDPMYDASQTWYAMILLWCLTFGQAGAFLYSRREGI